MKFFRDSKNWEEKEMTGFTMIDMVILIAYLGLVLLAGLHFSKKDMKGK